MIQASLRVSHISQVFKFPRLINVHLVQAQSPRSNGKDIVEGDIKPPTNVCAVAVDLPWELSGLWYDIYKHILNQHYRVAYVERV